MSAPRTFRLVVTEIINSEVFVEARSEAAAHHVYLQMQKDVCWSDLHTEIKRVVVVNDIAEVQP